MEIANVFNKLFKSSEEQLVKKVQIFHVGQGHHSRMYLNEQDYINYDVGYSLCYNFDITLPNTEINHKHCKGVILSHWDMDTV